MSKNNYIQIRLSEEEKLQLKVNANIFQLSMSEYLRFLILLQPTFTKTERNEIYKTHKLLLDNQTYKELSVNLTQIGNNLNQAVRALNTMKKMPNVRIDAIHLEDIKDSIIEVEDIVSQTKKQLKQLKKKTIGVK